MKIGKRNGVYTLDWYDAQGKRKRRSLGTRDRDVAERKAQDLMTGKDIRSDVWTLRKALEHTLEHVWADSKSFKSFESIVRLVCEELGHLTLDEVTYETLEDWARSKRKQDLKPATINRRLAAIGRALKEAVRRGKLQAVPPMPKQIENNKRLRWLNEAEERALLAGCSILMEKDAILMRHVIVFLIDTGARLGEMLKLMPEHVSSQPAAVRFEDTKSRADKYRARTVPLTKRALVAAREITKLNQYNLMWTINQLSHRFDRAAKDAGLADINRHTLRHTCASRLVQRGADIYRVKEWLGHSNITVTERYAHLADTGMDDMAGLLEPVTHDHGLSTNGHSARNVTTLPQRKAR